MVDPQTVSLEVAKQEHELVLTNLLELYVHDMSEFLPIEIGAEGRFGYDRLPRYWSEPEQRFAFLIYSGENLAGFALVVRGSPVTDDREDLDVAEFFVLRRHRRSSVGQRAPCLLWNRLPGQWVVRVSAANRRALPFWRTTVQQYTGGVFAERTLPGSPHDWQVFTFGTSAAELRRDSAARGEK
jgi:predicted acetyltransferase